MATESAKKALLLIDIQNDYFPDGAFPLWNTDNVKQATLKAIEKANDSGVFIIHVQHIANSAAGPSPFFNANTPGVQIQEEIFAAAPSRPIVVKEYADSFHNTNLEEILSKNGITDLLVAGMMTHNCVTHTAISKAAEKYNVSVLTDLTTTVSEILHLIALHALSTRVTLTTSTEAIK